MPTAAGRDRDGSGSPRSLNAAQALLDEDKGAKGSRAGEVRRRRFRILMATVVVVSVTIPALYVASNAWRARAEGGSHLSGGALESACLELCVCLLWRLCAHHTAHVGGAPLLDQSPVYQTVGSDGARRHCGFAAALGTAQSKADPAEHWTILHRTPPPPPPPPPPCSVDVGLSVSVPHR